MAGTATHLRARAPDEEIEIVRRRWLVGGQAAAAPVLILVATVAAAFVLLRVDRRDNGSQSAALSVLALGAVAVSLFIQSRQARASQAQAVRTMQLELMRMLIEHPVLHPASPSHHDQGDGHWQRNIYVNLFFKYMEMGLELGYVAEPTLHMQLAKQFEVPAVRYFWRVGRQAFATDARSRAAIRFFEIADEQYRRALVSTGSEAVEGLSTREATPGQNPSATPSGHPRSRFLAKSPCRDTAIALAMSLAAVGLAGVTACFARRNVAG